MNGPILVSQHALDRYLDRVKPHLSREQAIEEIKALCRLVGEPALDPPTWLHESEDAWVGGEYLEVTDGLCFVLDPRRRGRTVVTVLARAGVAEETRQRRNEKRAKRRRARRTRNQNANNRRRGRAVRTPLPEDEAA